MSLGIFDTERETFETVRFREFDLLANDEDWEDGPYRSSFGDGYGEPYNPNREVWGILQGGRRVQSNTGDF